MPESAGTWSAQVGNDLNRRLENYHEHHGVSRSETVRMLLRKGLESENGEKSDSGDQNINLLIAILTALLGSIIALGILTHGITGAATIAVAGAIGFGIAKVALSNND